VIESLQRLAGAYLAVAEVVLGVRFRRGGATNHAFRRKGEAVGLDLRMWLAGDESVVDPKLTVIDVPSGAGRHAAQRLAETLTAYHRVSRFLVPRRSLHVVSLGPSRAHPPRASS